MAINSPFFLDAADLATATAVYLDLALTNIAPDGFYGDGTITREQSSGILLTAEACATCGTPCGSSISGSGGQGIYLVNLDTGTIDTGAIIIRFFPQNIPDGIRVTYDGVVYNKLSSPAFGELQSPNYGHYTIVGASSSVSTCSSWYPSGGTLPSLTEYLWNGTSFISTGNTQSVTIDVADILLTTTSPLFCVMVIPKPTGTPNNVLLEMLGPCSGTAWDLTAVCPVALPSFLSSIEYESSFISCAAPLTQTYYFASVQNTPAATVELYDYVFSDANGEFPLVNGFYLTNNVAVPNKVIEVNNGIIVAITACNTACLDCVPGTEVTIGTQEWTVCNLDVTTYSNGDTIPEVTDATTWDNLTTGAWCYYDNDPLNGPTYGKLYNGYAVNDPRGLAPIGYHIPTDAEWTTLANTVNALVPIGNVGGKMKETGLCHWDSPNTDATNLSGFTALPGGCRGDFGLFVHLGANGDWWSRTNNGVGLNYIRYLNSFNGVLNSGSYTPNYGFSVRLIQDTTPLVQLDWSFVETSANGVMVIYVEGNSVITRNVSDIGTYFVNVGDVIGVTVSCTACSAPNDKANVSCTGIINDLTCVSISASINNYSGYTVTSGDVGTILTLDTFAQCTNICL
jgi:uncharacterized protein (TIGR02145 family)